MCRLVAAALRRRSRMEMGDRVERSPLTSHLFTLSRASSHLIGGARQVVVRFSGRRPTMLGSFSVSQWGVAFARTSSIALLSPGGGHQLTIDERDRGRPGRAFSLWAGSVSSADLVQLGQLLILMGLPEKNTTNGLGR